MSDMIPDGRFGEESPLASSLARRQDPGQATQIEQARAVAEVRAAVMIAMENPRNEDRARAKMQRVCKMSALAERAFFRVPRGNKKDENGRNITGPDGKPIPEYVNGETIQLARELARCWGNIDYSVRELLRNDAKGQSEMMAVAWDLEENVRPTAVFIVEHKLGKYKITSNQQIYENNAGHAGRRLREMLFNVLPEWFKAEAIELCHETLRKGDGRPFGEQLSKAITAFKEIGVSVEMLQAKIGRSIGESTPEDLATLRIVLRSIKRNEVTVADEFPVDEPETVAPVQRPENVGTLKAALNPAASTPETAGETSSDTDSATKADASPAGSTAGADGDFITRASAALNTPGVAIDKWFRALKRIVETCPTTGDLAVIQRHPSVVANLKDAPPQVRSDIQYLFPAAAQRLAPPDDAAEQ